MVYIGEIRVEVEEECRASTVAMCRPGAWTKTGP